MVADPANGSAGCRARDREEQDMSSTEQVRPEVVAAIVRRCGNRPRDLPADATRAEKDAAKDQYLSGWSPSGPSATGRPGPGSCC